MPEADFMLETSSASERPWHRNDVRSPRIDETWIALPELPRAAGLGHANRQQFAARDVSVQGRSLALLRAWTRREVLAAASEYTAGILGRPVSDVGADTADPAGAVWYVGGHQPTLFHPGVWVKNFVVGALARREQGIGLNLVVDNDTLSTTAVRVPAGTRDQPRVDQILFDEPRSTRPWEEARLINRALFESFPARVEEKLSDWGIRPLLGEFWPAAVRQADRSDRLADCLTAARHCRERQWGNSNLELPLSRLCRLDPFLWFTAHLLAHMPRFHAHYNEVLREYRHVNRVRGRTHPVPDLRQDGGWFEAPFWIWKEGDVVRQRLFARQEGKEVLLSNGTDVLAALPLTAEKEACCAVEALRDLQNRGWRLRTRALTTTLFARLCLADLFVHGLGGAKYDEMTDRLIARFFHLPAPGFLLLSATVRLPLAPHPVDPSDEVRLRRQLRELDYHSERHLPSAITPELAELVAEKNALIAAQHEVAAARGGEPSAQAPRGLPAGFERFRRLQQVNRRLAQFTQPERQRLRDELTRTSEQLAANVVLQNREYPFCLFPAEKLQRFMDHVCSGLGR
jgi:hypothetical protein